MSRRRLVRALLLSAASPLARAQEVPLRVDVVLPEAPVYLQQPVELRVRLGYDPAWLAAHAVPLFQQRLELPFHLVVPWLLGADDRAVEVLAPPADAAVRRAAVGDRVLPLQLAAAAPTDWQVLELRCRWLPLAAGDAAVAPVTLRIAYAERFDEDFLRGRTPIDRREAVVASPALRLPVRPLPQPAPPGFGGAVGKFEVQASCAVREAAVGSSVPVQLLVTGAGNLERFAPLAPPRLPGCFVQGVAESRAVDRRVVTLDLVPLRAGMQALPPVPFVAFDPELGEYRTQWTEPLPLLVRAVDAATLPPRVRELIDEDRRLHREPGWLPWWGWPLGCVLLGGMGFALRARGRRLAQRQRVAAARQAVLAAWPAGPGALAAAFDAWCAARGGAVEWGAADGWAQLARAGVAAGELAALRALHAQLDAARFGGGLPERDGVAALLLRAGD